MRKIKRSIWLPVVLLIYFACITFIFAPDLIRTHQIPRLLTVAIVEVIIIILLHFFLKKRENIR